MATVNSTRSTSGTRAPKSASTIEAARIAGALKGFDALRKLRTASNYDPAFADETASEFYARRLSVARVFVAALGPMTPEQEGAVAVLAEFIVQETEDCVVDLSPGGWRPLSTMTDKEFQAEMKELEDEIAADNAAIEQQKASRKVVSITDRRAAQ